MDACVYGWMDGWMDEQYIESGDFGELMQRQNNAHANMFLLHDMFSTSL